MWTGAGKIAAFVPPRPAGGVVWFRGVPPKAPTARGKVFATRKDDASV